MFRTAWQEGTIQLLWLFAQTCPEASGCTESLWSLLWEDESVAFNDQMNLGKDKMDLGIISALSVQRMTSVLFLF